MEPASALLNDPVDGREMIDAVVAWVDGSDPVHREKRLASLARIRGSEPHPNGLKEHRFADHDEVRYCIRSIRNHAPWIRTIWLVTDNQFPASFDRTAAEAAGVRVVDHRVLFRGYESALPTFNSQSIETVLWRIPGLTDKFLYFNDDMFLTRAVKPGDFFTEDGVVLRGRWSEVRDRRALHAIAEINAARMMGFVDKYISVKHVIYPMMRSAWEALFAEFGSEIEHNLGYQFRDVRQFWPISLHHHYLFKNGRLEEAKAAEVVHFSVTRSAAGDAGSARRKLRRLISRKTIAACLNELPAIKAKVPDVYLYVEQAVGPAVSFENPAHPDSPASAAARQKASVPFRIPRLPEQQKPEERIPAYLDLVGAKGTKVQRRIARRGLRAHHRFTQAAILALMSGADGATTFYDVGANIGLYPALGAHLFGRRGFNAIGFEAATRIYRKALRLRRRNRFKYRLVNVALGAKPSEEDGQAPDRTKAIDDLVAEGLPPPTLIRIGDIHTECDVLAGAAGTIAEHRPYIVCTMSTMPDPAMMALVERLAGSAYSFYAIRDNWPFEELTPAGLRSAPRKGRGNWILAPKPLSEAFGRQWKSWLTAIAECGPLTPSRPASPVVVPAGPSTAQPRPVNFVLSRRRHTRGMQRQMLLALQPHFGGARVTTSRLTVAQGAINMAFFIGRPADVFMSHGVADKNYLFKQRKDGSYYLNSFRHVLVPGEWERQRLVNSPAITVADENIHVVGWLRLDLLAAMQAAAPVPPLGDRKIRVLWAPTHDQKKDDVSGAVVSSFPLFQEHIPALADHFDVQVALHPINSVDKIPTAEKLVWADVVIADFGTLVFEALALGKPVVFPGWIMGDLVVRNFPDSAPAFLYEQRIGAHAASIGEMIEMISAGLQIDDRTRSFADSVIDPRFLGGSGKRVADLLLRLAAGADEGR